ncbi:hypothetical protein EOS_35810 [Caballeronia mineralivorans PML1(12)]|uniref:Secretion protein n=1 Tax=Caballeronia mineralivorans PML1(12) TaxID=908627 RepID=A0A0J1CM01_9BURK|nr:hypothetical protein EOS_35810 [Caballeronia mineralivorans PML1(12)]
MDDTIRSPAGGDPVRRYLAARGLDTRLAHFEGSEFVLGRRVEWGELELSYRFQDGVVFICSVESLRPPEGIGGAVKRLVELLLDIAHEVPEVKEIRGLVTDDAGDREQRIARVRLKQVLMAEGAIEVEYDGARWLSLKVRS